VVRRLAAAAIVTGLALVVLASIAGAEEGIEAVSPTDVVAEATANLNGAHVGATNPGFTTEGCPAPANTTNFAGTWAWHFVLPGSTSDFVTLTVVFDAPDHSDVSGGVDSNPGDNLTITGGVGVAFVSSPTGKHAYVYTPGPDYMLLSGTATVTGDETSFNLSHVCPGTTTTTTAPTPTTTVAPTTTTVAPTTTTTLVSPTTVTQETTTTSSPLVTTPGPTAGAAEASQGLPRTGSGTSLPLLFAGIGLIVGGGILLIAARRVAGGSTL